MLDIDLQAEQAFLQILKDLHAAHSKHLENESTSNHKHLHPFVTLSYAQSIDGSISSHSSTQLLLSGNQSLRLTHLLRAYHDAILVGIQTVCTDDPSLTVRYGVDKLISRLLKKNTKLSVSSLSLSSSSTSPSLLSGPLMLTPKRELNEAYGNGNHEGQEENRQDSSDFSPSFENLLRDLFNSRYTNQIHPKPLIIDSKLRCPPSAKLLSDHAPRKPLIATCMDADNPTKQKASFLSLYNVHLIHCKKTPSNHVDLNDLMENLNAHIKSTCAKTKQRSTVMSPQGNDDDGNPGDEDDEETPDFIRSIMVEGGAQIISSFLTQHLVHYVIITISPQFVGGYSVLDPRFFNQGTDGSREQLNQTHISTGLNKSHVFPSLRNVKYYKISNDLIVTGELN